MSFQGRMGKIRSFTVAKTVTPAESEKSKNDTESFATNCEPKTQGMARLQQVYAEIEGHEESINNQQ